MKNIRSLFLTLILLLTTLLVHAGGGMWLPILLNMNEEEMQAMGMKMSVEDIYSVNKGSLKDAVIQLGGCTAEIISGSGLVLTNHHCAYGSIQSLSSLENNYLEDGFWAMNKAEELPTALTATFLVRMEDVTAKATQGVTNDMTEEERQSTIDQNINAIVDATDLKEHEEANVRAFFKGNQFFLLITQTYRDVRLVGAPPSSIGKFGADTDNWAWPRHTGDFSLVRIYADADNQPADFSEDNVPLKPKHFLPISMDGVEKEDFTLLMGFPGSTNSYLPAAGLRNIMEIEYPIGIAVRDKALAIIDESMRRDAEIKIKYASKFASLANYWKKWKGELQGLLATDALEQKLEQEADFQRRVKKHPEKKEQYGDLLQQLKQNYVDIRPYLKTQVYFDEVIARNVELLLVNFYMNRLVSYYDNNGEAGYLAFKSRLAPYLANLYKNYDADLDQEVFSALLEMYVKHVDPNHIPPNVLNMVGEAENNYPAIAAQIYAGSMLTDGEQVAALLELEPAEAIEKIQADPAYQFTKTVLDEYRSKVAPEISRIEQNLYALNRTYMRGLMDMYPDKHFYPDANSTMRVSYGYVEGYEPRDAVDYEPFTHLSGVMEKYIPGDYEFDVPEKLRELFKRKDFGPYGKDGKMPVCFTASNHSTNGNSGSPVIDAHGNLIGLNFDRAWEGTMSDLNYDRSICRNISVDVRYILFIIDKFAGAGHLIDEMKLVHPKK